MKSKKLENKAFFSVPEAAKVMGVSRITVFNKIVAGKIKATKVGRDYIIAKDDLASVLGEFISPEQKQEIETAVKKAVKEYRTTFRRLGEEK